MQYVVHGHHLDLTPSLKERCHLHVQERAEKLVDDSAARLEIELADHFGGGRHGKADKSCRIDMRVPGLPPIHIAEMRPTMAEAIDLAADRMAEALRRGLERRESARRRAHKEDLGAPPSKESPELEAS
jgi:ribosome-associated translation inhibitor RaiA